MQTAGRRGREGGRERDIWGGKIFPSLSQKGEERRRKVQLMKSGQRLPFCNFVQFTNCPERKLSSLSDKDRLRSHSRCRQRSGQRSCRFFFSLSVQNLLQVFSSFFVACARYVFCLLRFLEERGREEGKQRERGALLPFLGSGARLGLTHFCTDLMSH